METNKVEEIMEKVIINTDYIKLDQFLKWSGAAQSGADAKEMVQSGKVKVNGALCTERGKKLRKGDTVEVSGKLIFEVS